MILTYYCIITMIIIAYLLDPQRRMDRQKILRH